MRSNSLDYKNNFKKKSDHKSDPKQLKTVKYRITPVFCFQILPIIIRLTF